MKWVHNDGGRASAGFKGDTGDCVCRAIAIAAELPYLEVYNALNELGGKERRTKRRSRKSSARTGVHRPTIRRFLEARGWTWTPTMAIGSGCKVHLRSGELPQGRLIVSVSGHMVAVIHGVAHDTHDPTRNGTRCVYGYFQKLEACVCSSQPGRQNRRCCCSKSPTTVCADAIVADTVFDVNRCIDCGLVERRTPCECCG